MPSLGVQLGEVQWNCLLIIGDKGQTRGMGRL